MVSATQVRTLPVSGMVMSPAPVRSPPTRPAQPPLSDAMLQLLRVSSSASISGSRLSTFRPRFSLHLVSRKDCCCCALYMDNFVTQELNEKRTRDFSTMHISAQ